MPRSTREQVTPASLQGLISKRFGPRAMIRGSDPSMLIKRLPSGLLVVDWALGGGFPRSRHVELYGPPSTGKTSLAYCLIATTQVDGGRCAFIDVEGKWDGEYAASLGVDIEELELHPRQENGHKLVDFTETLLRSEMFDVICLDSISALLPKGEQESSMEDGDMGTQQARLMSKALRKLTPALGNCCMLYINQVRENVGAGMFAKRNVTSGGRALGHYASQRIELVRTETLKRKVKQVNHQGETKIVETPVGHRILMRVQKEQTGGAHEGDTATFVFNYDLGRFDAVEDLVYLGLNMGLVHRSGNNWWVEGYDDEKQLSRAKFIRWLRRNRAVAQDLEDMIMNHEPQEVETDE